MTDGVERSELGRVVAIVTDKEEKNEETSSAFSESAEVLLNG